MITIRGVEIGSGLPKICVPITGVTPEDIMKQANNIQGLDVELVEWRVDCCNFVNDYKKIEDTLKQLRERLNHKILLFTFRSKREGGEQELSKEEYFALNCFAGRSKLVDIVDIELFSGDKEVVSCIETLHNEGCKVIISNHDFHQTPEVEEIVGRLCRMQQLGGDILKIAVMPNSPLDVTNLLSATYQASSKLEKPVVTMSMSKLGVVSRLAGGVFGSAITFGTAGKVSAPGQIPVDELKTYLKFFSKSEMP